MWSVCRARRVRRDRRAQLARRGRLDRVFLLVVRLGKCWLKQITQTIMLGG